MNGKAQLAMMSRTRLAILSRMKEGETSRKIATGMKMNISAITRHMRVCRDMGFVDGPFVATNEVFSMPNLARWQLTKSGESLLSAIANLENARGHGTAILSCIECHSLLSLISEA